LKISKELKTGLLAVVAIAVIILGFNFLKGKNYFDNSNIYYAVYGNVEGLVESAPVTINGFRVGKVLDISFADRSGKLVVAFSVEEDFEFSRNSVVEIYSSGFIGGNNLGIKVEHDPANRARSGDTLKGSIEQGVLDQVTGKLAPLEAKVQGTLTNLDSLLTNLNQVLNDKSKENIQYTIADLRATVAQFKGASAKVNAFLEDNNERMGNTLANLDRTSENFAVISDSLSQIQFGNMIASLELTVDNMNSVIGQIKNGEGSLGKLLQDEALYNNLSGASLELELLLRDMKENPKRYVHFSIFGKRAKPYETEEQETN
jgi:phospholipid/cholesterol/gamma-HCH transport system substrate-binding protein